MLDRLRARFHRPSPATAIALVALFVALGGTGYAALKLPKNSVGTKQLKNNAVTGAKVKDGSLTAGDFGGTLPTGAQGPKGDTGAAGAAGAAGTNGTNGAKGDKGDKGDDGTDGTNGTGTQGPTGPSGTSLKPKATGGPQTTSGAVTLANSSWSQGANKPNEVLYRVSWTPPPGTCTAGGPPPGGQIDIKLDGTTLQNPQAVAGGGATVVSGTAALPSTNSAQPHTVSITLADNCTGPEDATVNSATFEIIEFG
jgi:hypothetical protein